SPPGPGSTFLLGIAAAVIVLLISFGSFLAMGLPVGTAVFGLVTGLSIVGLASNLMDFAEFSSELAGMIGLGVGVDYALFILTRYREIYRNADGHHLTGVEQQNVRN